MILAGIISTLTISCRDHNDLYQGPPADETKNFNDFDYTTSSDVTLQISYQNMGGIETSVDFEVYDQMPVENKGYAYVKKEGVEAIYADRTREDGTFSMKIPVPAYTKTLYIYTHAFYARTLLEAKVENGIAVATDAPEDETRAAAFGRGDAQNYCIPVIYEGWHDFLGTYSSDKGEINYKYKGNLAYTTKEANNLYKIQSSVINSSQKCPQEFRASTDMYINENAEIAVTILGGNTCWNSSMGYYYYKEGNAPSSLIDANIILVFPNTQDGEWSNDSKKAKKGKGVDRGTSVQLMYYPNVAKNSKEGATTIFPAGYRIGFILATNGWTGRLSGFESDKLYRAATSKGLSIDNNGKSYNSPRTAVYRYDNKKDINAVIFSFEDHTNDENFSDVVFTLKTNPINAIDDIPVVTENKSTIKTLKGVYAFEDLWPSQGDYDMNDVLVVSRYEKVYDAGTLDKGIYEESFYFKTLENIANNRNGLGFTLVNGGNDPEITLTIDGKEAPFTQKGNVLLITDDVKSKMGLDYKLTLKYKDPIKKAEAGAKPFIWKNNGENGNWEVHIAKETPTPWVAKSFFHTEDDLSDLTQGIYYVREGNYPFAFFLVGATENDISKLLESENESKAIDEVYPKYKNWVTSGGSTNQDWYK